MQDSCDVLIVGAGASGAASAWNLSKHFDVSPPLITRLVSREEKSILKAVEGIGFEIQQGET